MLVDAPQINALYLSGVNELKKDGIVPTPEEYAWLYELSRKSLGETREAPQYIAPDVFMCGVVLHPLTMGASEWWEHFGEHAYSDASDLDRILAWAWLLHHAQDPEYLNRHTSRWHIKAAVAKFVLMLPKTISIEAIGWAVSAVLNSNKIEIEGESNKHKGVVKAGSSTTWGDILARLSHEYKRPPEDFLWRMSIDQLTTLNKESYNKDGKASDNDSAHFFGEWRAVLNEIRRNHNGKNVEE